MRLNRILLIFVVFAFPGLLGCEGTLDGELGDFDQSQMNSIEAAYEADPAEDPTAGSEEASELDSTKADEVDDAVEDVNDEAETVEPVEDDAPEDEEEVEEEIEEPVGEPGTYVDFFITNGTGSDAWNSRDEPVVIYVGQILRVFNDDSRDHQIHSPDDGPFPHGNRIAPGAFATYEIEAPLEIGDRATLYDHNDGPSAAFWVMALERD